jgi:hypothetical protein
MDGKPGQVSTTGLFSLVRIRTTIQILIRQRPTKPSFHQWIEPPEDGPVENTTRHLGRKLSILRKEDRSLLPGLGGQDDRFNGSGRSRKPGKNLDIPKKPQRPDVYAVEEQGGQKIDINDCRWTD